MTRLFTIVLLGIVLLFPFPAHAQDPTPEPGPEAATMLPDAGAFGEGWTLVETVSPDLLARYSFEMTPDVFREGAAGIYVGPAGSRIVLVALLLTDSRVAIRQSWEDATELLDAVKNRASTDYERDQALETMEPPPTCVEAKRFEGLENFTLQPVGGTMCAIDPDVIVISIVWGTYGEESGVSSSDAVIGESLAA